MARRTQTLVQLSEELVERLDRVAARRSMSRSGLIREMLEGALVEHERDEVTRRIVEGYTQAPQSEARDAWGDLESWAETVARRNLAALRTEEGEEGW